MQAASHYKQDALFGKQDALFQKQRPLFWDLQQELSLPIKTHTDFQSIFHRSDSLITPEASRILTSPCITKM
jgi:hypothetical protein